MAIREVPRSVEAESGNPLTQMFEEEGFLDFLGELEEFDSLDKTGRNASDNSRIEKIYRAYKEYPGVVGDLQILWQSKAVARQVTLSPESLKKIEDEVLAAIKRGEIEIVDNFARQVAEYKALPQEIDAKKQQIADFEASIGNRDKLQRKKRGLDLKIEEKDEHIEDLDRRREAKDAIGQNRKILENTEKSVEDALKGIKAEQLHDAWQILRNNPETFLTIAGLPESQKALSRFDKLEAEGSPLALIREIQKDRLAAANSPEAGERAAANLQKLIELAANPVIKSVLDKIVSAPETRMGIEGLEPDFDKRHLILKNRGLRSGCEQFLGRLNNDDLENTASSPDQIGELAVRIETLQNAFGDSQVARSFEFNKQQLRSGTEELLRFDRGTLKDAQSSWEVAGYKPGIFIREFFTKHGPHQRDYSVRKAEGVRKQIESLEKLQAQKRQMETKYDAARENIFKIFPQAESLLADLDAKVDEKFGALLADDASLQSYFKAADYFDLLVTADDDPDDVLEVVRHIGAVETRRGSVAEAKKGLMKKIVDRMVKEVRTSLENVEKITPSKVKGKLQEIRTGLGEAIINKSQYQEMELAALRKVHTDRSIKSSGLAALENIFPQLREAA
jgi:hypothetical protein